jgi:precorrin-3B methylase
MKQGSLIITGSGIRGPAHVTLEAAAWIREAELVMYWVADPATEAWIRQQNPNCLDLGCVYREGERRETIYRRMADCILGEVRSGKDVCAVYYGHPGIFVASSHWAVAMARAEGYPVAMLPGISAEDYLCAEIGFDPSTHGCQSLEATDLLLHKRPLLTDSHVIIWQIAHVGVLDYSRQHYDTSRLPILIEYLERFYRPDHCVFHYQGSPFPVCASSIEYLKLSEMREARTSSISTLYIPPATERELDPEMADRLGIPLSREGTAPDVRNADGESEAPTAMAGRQSPRPVSQALAAFLNKLAQNPRLMASFCRDPRRVAARHGNLSARDMAALLSGRVGSVWQAMACDDAGAAPEGARPTRPDTVSAGIDGAGPEMAGPGLAAAIPQPAVTAGPRRDRFW